LERELQERRLNNLFFPTPPWPTRRRKAEEADESPHYPAPRTCARAATLPPPPAPHRQAQSIFFPPPPWLARGRQSGARTTRRKKQQTTAPLFRGVVVIGATDRFNHPSALALLRYFNNSQIILFLQYFNQQSSIQGSGVSLRQAS
jgi:hypothetical protein